MSQPIIVRVLRPYLRSAIVATFLVLSPAGVSIAWDRDGVSLAPYYKYHPGDTTGTTWSAPDFDDQAWMSFESNRFPHEAWNGTGWFRFVVFVDSSLWRQPVGLTVGYTGTLELYIDGVFIPRTGLAGEARGRQTPVVQKVPAVVPIVFRPSAASSNPSRHIVAIRYATSALKEAAWTGLTPGFGFNIGNLAVETEARVDYLQRWRGHQMSLVGISLAFALLHLSLFIFYTDPRANLYFALIALGYAVNVFFDVEGTFQTEPHLYLWADRLNNAGTLLMLLSALLLTYSLFYQKRPLHYWGFAIAGGGLLIHSWLRPLSSQTTPQIFALLAFLEIARVLAAAWRKRLRSRLQGGRIIAVGLIPSVLALIGERLIQFGILPAAWALRDTPLERYAFLIFLAAVSVFLAYNFARTSRDLQLKKVELQDEIGEKSEAMLALQRALGEVDSLKNRLEAENVYLQDEIKLEHNFSEIVTQSKRMNSVLRQVEQVAATDATVLITGESGTGKELLARAVHNISARSERPLVKVNCAALPANLIESELFGHEKGAFTGAIAQRIGRFELADGGTLFLDEIGEMPLELQTKLLRVLQEGEFERLGLSKTLQVDVRVITATNRDLEKAIKDGNFREDLFYRLNVFPIHHPPLRARKEDIPLLVNHFVKKYGTQIGKTIESIPQDVLDTFQSYAWPGNVRELENIIERAVIITTGPTLQIGDWLSDRVARGGELSTLEQNEREHILQVLEHTRWRVAGSGGAAEILGLKRTTLIARMQKLGLQRST